MKFTALAVTTLVGVASANDYQPALRALAVPEPAAPNAVAPAAAAVEHNALPSIHTSTAPQDTIWSKMEAAAEMSPILQEKLNDVLSRYDALEAILVCTSEGVPLLKVSAEEKSELSYEYTETVLPTVFAGAAEQVGKLKFGAVQSVTAFFDDVVLIHINHAPLVITLVAPNSPHTGALHALASELRPALTPLKKCVESADVH